jgi:hypothetical protein
MEMVVSHPSGNICGQQHRHMMIIIRVHIKGNAVPLQGNPLPLPLILPMGPRGFWEVKAWRWLVVSLTQRPSLPPEVSWYSFLIAWVDMELSEATEKIPMTTPGIDPGTFRLQA